jgi:hypothetical protein
LRSKDEEESTEPASLFRNQRICFFWFSWAYQPGLSSLIRR